MKGELLMCPLGKSGEARMKETQNTGPEMLWAPDIGPILSNVLPNWLVRMPRTEAAVLYITSLIVNYDEECGLAGEWVPLHSKTLSQVVGWRYNHRLLEELVAAGVLECDESYQVGATSKGYRLTPAIARFPKVLMPAPPWIAHRIQAQRHRRNLEAIGASASARVIFGDLARFGWSPNIAGVLEALNREDELTAGHYRLAVDRIAHRQHFITVAESGRLYHTIATMSKKLRSRLLADEQECCELDVAGCQANCLVRLYEAGDEEERTRYIAAARHDPYEFIAALIESAGLPRPDREAVKLAWFKEVFGEAYLRSQVYDALQRAFPVLCARMEAIRKPGYRQMARCLQRIEADLIIRKVVPAIKARLGATPISTIHDSILCLRKVGPDVKVVMEEVLESELGYVPLIRMK